MPPSVYLRDADKLGKHNDRNDIDLAIFGIKYHIKVQNLRSSDNAEWIGEQFGGLG